MRFLQGMSIAETAGVLGRSEGAVKQLQLRGVRNLAKLMPEGIRVMSRDTSIAATAAQPRDPPAGVVGWCRRLITGTAPATTRTDRSDEPPAPGATTRRATSTPSSREPGATTSTPAAAELLELVGALRSVPAPQARPEFVADLRERLMLAAESELRAGPAPRRERDDAPGSRSSRGAPAASGASAIALGAVAIVGATTSMAVASQGAIPGDALYPLKRAIENTQAGFSVGDDAKGETILGNASGRLDEVDKLTRRSDAGRRSWSRETLNTFSDQATEAGDLLIADYEQHGNEASIQQLHEFTANSIDTLARLEAVDPAGAPHDALLNAAAGRSFALDAGRCSMCARTAATRHHRDPGAAAGQWRQALDDVADASRRPLPARRRPTPHPRPAQADRAARATSPAASTRPRPRHDPVDARPRRRRAGERHRRPAPPTSCQGTATRQRRRERRQGGKGNKPQAGRPQPGHRRR